MGGTGFDSWRWSSVKSDAKTTRLTRRQMLGRTGQAALGSVVLTPLIQGAILSCASAAETGLKGVAGIDRVTILPGKTYLRGWAGYGDPPRSNQNRGRQDTPPRALDGPAHTAMWTKDSGPGEVKFDDATALITTATFSTPGAYVLRLTVDNGQSKDSSTLNVSAETPPPAKQLDAVYTKNFKIDSIRAHRCRAGVCEDLALSPCENSCPLHMN